MDAELSAPRREGETQVSEDEAEGGTAEPGRSKRLGPQNCRNSHPWVRGQGPAAWSAEGGSPPRANVAAVAEDNCCVKVPNASQTLRQECGDQEPPASWTPGAECARKAVRQAHAGRRAPIERKGQWRRGQAACEVEGHLGQSRGGRSRAKGAASCQAAPATAAGGRRRALGGLDGS